jgi:hypothetical protein
MADDINIDITNQDYDIDVILDATYFGPGGGGPGGKGWITYSGTPVSGQIPVFTSVSNVMGTANLVYNGSNFITPSAIIEEIATDHIYEKTPDHGIVLEDQAHADDIKNIGSNLIIGWGGWGYSLKYEEGIVTMELDNLIVRGRLAVSELVIQKIKHMGGALMISAGDGEVKSWTGTYPTYNLYFDTGKGNEIMFEVGDYVTAQQWSAGVKKFDGQVTYKGTDYITVTAVSGSDTPWDGMDLCQFGHPTETDRQNVILLKATDPINPNNPIIVGYAGIDDGVFADHMKFAIGNLEGIDDPDFGELEGFGFFADNVYLKGFISIVGADGYINISDRPTSLNDISTTEYSDLQTAITNSGTAIGLINDYGSDTKVVPGEKKTLKQMWDAIVVEGYPTTGTIPAEAIALGVSHTTFDNAYAALDTYLNTTLNLFGDMGETTTVVRSTWDTKWKDYYNAKIALLTAIAQQTSTMATWDLIDDLPTTLTPVDTDPGLKLTAGYMGYWDGNSWNVYIDNTGDMVLGNYAGTSGLWWDESGSMLHIKGSISITNTIPTDVITGLADIAESGSWADLDYIPDRFKNAPTGEGLFICADYMGYYSGSQWKSYIDNDGNCYFEGLSALNCITTAYSEGNMGITISGADLYESEYDGVGILYVNRLGYNGGYTRSRYTYFYNGTGYDSDHLMFAVGYDGVYAYGDRKSVV